MTPHVSQGFTSSEITVSASIDWNGAVEVVREKYFSNGGVENMPSFPEYHSFNGNTLKLVSVNCVKDSSRETYSLASATYRGKAFDRKVIRYEASLSVEPIQSHPDFADFAGTEYEPNELEARWISEDGRNVFVSFREDSDFAGIESYYAARWSVSVESLSELQFPYKVATVYSEIDGGYLLGGEFLCSGCTSEPVGYVNRVVAHMVHANQWDNEIYKTRG